MQIKDENPGIIPVGNKKLRKFDISRFFGTIRLPSNILVLYPFFCLFLLFLLKQDSFVVEKKKKKRWFDSTVQVVVFFFFTLRDWLLVGFYHVDFEQEGLKMLLQVFPGIWYSPALVIGVVSHIYFKDIAFWVKKKKKKKKTHRNIINEINIEMIRLELIFFFFFFFFWEGIHSNLKVCCYHLWSESSPSRWHSILHHTSGVWKEEKKRCVIIIIIILKKKRGGERIISLVLQREGEREKGTVNCHNDGLQMLTYFSDVVGYNDQAAHLHWAVILLTPCKWVCQEQSRREREERGMACQQLAFAAVVVVVSCFFLGRGEQVPFG